MSDAKPGPRPSQVTTAGWVSVVGAVFLVFAVYEAIANLGSLEVRQSIEEVLSSPPYSGLGVEVPQVVEAMRIVLLFIGCAAAAIAVLGVYVLQRHNPARIGFTILAIPIALSPLFLLAPFSGGFLAVLIGFTAVMLWTRPARDWFAGRPAAETAPRDRRSMSTEQEPPRRPQQGLPPRPQPPPPAPETQGPPPTHGFGTAPDPGSGEPTAGGAPGAGPGPSPAAGQNPYGYPGAYPQGAYGQPGGYPAAPGQPSDARPTSVMVAALLTWFFAGITGALYVVVLVMLAVAQEPLIDMLRQDQNIDQLGIDESTLVAAMWGASALFIFWAGAAVLLAFLAFRRHNWARIALTVSAGATVLFSLAAIPFSVLHLLAAAATIVLLFVGGSNEWFARRPVTNSGAWPPGPGGAAPWGPPPAQSPQGQPWGTPLQGEPQQPPQPPQPPQEEPQRPPQGQPGQPQRPEGEKPPEPPKNVW